MSAPQIEPVTRVIDQTRVDAYAEAAPDFNPIHRETPEAYTGPFGRPIAHGMLLLALASEAMAASFGEAWAASGSMKVRWRAPAMPPVTVTASAELESDEDGIATYAFSCATDEGEVLLTARASVRYA